MDLQRIMVNGEERSVASRTVAELVSELGLKERRIALELNRAIVPRGAYEQTLISPGDQIEVVNFVGGG